MHFMLLSLLRSFHYNNTLLIYWFALGTSKTHWLIDRKIGVLFCFVCFFEIVHYRTQHTQLIFVTSHYCRFNVASKYSIKFQIENSVYEVLLYCLLLVRVLGIIWLLGNSLWTAVCCIFICFRLFLTLSTRGVWILVVVVSVYCWLFRKFFFCFFFFSFLGSLVITV